MYKMKSTRPGLFKMRPVYDVIPPGEKKTCRLIYKGLKPGQKPAMKDHFTIVLAIAPGTSTKIDNMWKQHKYHTKMANEEMRKKHLMIFYAGIHDMNQLQKVDDDDVLSGKKALVRKGRGLVDEDEPRPVVIQPANGRGPPVLLMYRPSKVVFDDDSDTDDENDDDDEGEKTTACDKMTSGKCGESNAITTTNTFPKASLVPLKK